VEGDEQKIEKTGVRRRQSGVDRGRFCEGDASDPPIKAKHLTPELLTRIRRGPKKLSTKVAVSIRLSAEVITYFRAQGPGWHASIDEALRRIAKKAG
jgi:uncharacterized protein (DUF4415 family)